MVGAGVLLIVFSLFALFLTMRKTLEKRRWFLWLLLFSIALPYLANTTGWILTEIGRQPWIVFGVMKTESAVSPNVNAASVLITLVVFTLLYGALAVVDIYLLAKYAKNPSAGHTEKTGAGEEEPS
jgi:cytochrome d ubiquinol oxidase subunit I